MGYTAVGDSSEKLAMPSSGRSAVWAERRGGTERKPVWLECNGGGSEWWEIKSER